jgi:thiosulfate/3-mercaptopyruvate sulfurtransferase
MNVTRYANPDAIVETEWLANNLSDPRLRVFDCTTFLHEEMGTGRPYRVESGRAEYEKAHIPGSAFLDLQEDLSDSSSKFRFTLPDVETLAARFAAKGIDAGSRVILYSRKRMQWTTRLWWMLRYVSFDNAAILNGGFDKWIAEGRLTETVETRYPPATLVARPRGEIFISKEEVKAAIGDAHACTINALAADLHRGENPRYGRPGRVPGSVNVPALSLVNETSLTLKSADVVSAAFAEVGADPSKRMLVYCGGGIAATLDAFLLHQLGYPNVAVYDNSMHEWANDNTLPIERDAA